MCTRLLHINTNVLEIVWRIYREDKSIEFANSYILMNPIDYYRYL